MYPLVAGRQVASAGAYEAIPLPAVVGHQADLRAYSIPVTDRTDEVDEEPVISVATLIAENNRVAVVTIDGNVDETIVVQVSKCGSAGGHWNLKYWTALR